MKSRILLLSGLLLLTALQLWSQVQVHSLRTDHLENPVGLDNAHPEFSWILASERPATLQTSYEIRAALDERDLKRGRNLLWSTGKVSSSQSVYIPYEGSELRSFQVIYWQVRVRDNHGKQSKWSPVASFEMGFLPGSSWKAQWIGPSWEEDESRSMPSPYLRKSFRLDKDVRQARLYISAQGLYRAMMNGKRVGDQEFTPGWTTYKHRIQYQVYDVGSLLQKNDNTLGIILGDGWHRGNLAFSGGRNTYGKEVSALAELHVEFSDGSTAIICTDESWKCSKGPILKSDIYNGESYDARRELEGWSLPAYDDRPWKTVKLMEPPAGQLVASEGPAVKVVNVLQPRSIEKRDEGWLVDMGQNMVGWIRLKARGESGDEIILRHAEVLDKEGQMYYENLRSAEQTNTYVLKGEGEEVFEPHFSFQGFRYVMVKGYPGELTADHIQGMVIHSAMEAIGTFSCSDSLINQLQHNIVWGLKGNFLDVPTDCPQRDERLGWTGDAQVFAPTACFNMDAAAFYRKWLKDLALDQGEDGMIPQVVPNMINGGGSTGWADAGVVIPWVLYLEYGDADVLKQQYGSMKKWIGYMQEHAGEDLIWQENDWHWGDWLAFDASRSDYMGAYTTKDLIATAYFSYSASLVAKTAAVLGKKEDAEYYSQLSDRVKEAFNAEYVTPNGRLVSHTQTAYTLALAFDMLNEAMAEKAAKHLATDVEQFGHITTGFLGTPLISLTLTKNGRNDLAYQLLNRKEYPSWLYPVTMGATTIWERWDGQKPDSTFQTPGMNSFNHYAYGAIGKWLYQVVAGISSDESAPGYKHILIHPRPGGGLSSARATYRSRYGDIVSGWKLQELEENGEKLQELEMEVVIPVNSTASIYTPGDPGQIRINGEVLEDTGLEYQLVGEELVVEAGSGHYLIRTRLK